MNETASVGLDDLKALLDQLVQATGGFTGGLLVTSHQAIAGMLVNALLVRELGRLGLIDADALRAEAIGRAAALGPERTGQQVADVIQSIFGGEPPAVPHIASQMPFTVIRGGLAEP